MSPERLLKHFERIADAPDAVPRLRRFILDLAVRGKLVEQDPKDEPAAELLKRIDSWRSAKLAEKMVRLPRKPLSEVKESESPYPLPTGWSWARLGHLIYIHSGDGLTAEAMRGGAIPVFGGNGINGFHDTPNVHEQTIVIGRVGYYCGSIHVTPPEAWVTDNAFITEFCHDAIFQSFLVLMLRATDLKENEGATAQPVISGSKIYPIVFGLPPLAEQKRIVAKVDELMGLCNELEAAQAKRESRRDRLVAATLHGLNNGESEAETGMSFPETARFYFNHLPRLTTRPEHIQQLRQTILNLAVRGRLVPQDLNDEPAATLLRHVRAEKGGQGKAGRKNLSSMPAAGDRMAPFPIPTGWLWAPLGEVVLDADAGWSPKTEGFPRSGNNWGVLKVSAVSWDRFLPEENKQLLPGVKPPESAQVRAGDFLISRANTSELVAKCVVVDEEPRNLILSDKIVRLQIAQGCNKRLLAIINNHAEYARAYYAKEASGTSLSMKNVSRPVIYALPIPLPPVAEQQRIVAKVDELMALCDELETHLTERATTRRQLLEATLAEALASGTEKTP